MSEFSLPSRYEFLSELGSGGMGVVLKANDVNLDKVVAIKILNKTALEHNPKHFQRFQHEAKAAGRLNHEGLVTVLDFGVTEDNFPYLVMEYFEGQTLKDRIKEAGALSAEDTLAILSQITVAMDHAHNNGVIHRDLKPANLLIVDIDGLESVKVVDFGIAKSFERKGDLQLLTQSGELLGTPSYMSPEQIAGKNVDQSTDIYSLGCIAYECLTGEVPFQGNNAMDTMNMHLSSLPPSINDSAEFPLALEIMVAKMLSKESTERHASMADLNHEINRILSDLHVDADESASSESGAAKSKINKLSILILVSSVLVVGFIGATIWSVLVSDPAEVAKTEITDSDSFKVPLTPSDVPPLEDFKMELASQIKKGTTCRMRYKALNRDMMIEIGKLGFGHLNFEEAHLLDPDSFYLMANPKTIAIQCNRGINFNDQVAHQFKQFKNLTSLDIADTKISEAGLVDIVKNNNLSMVELDRTAVTDDILQLIAEEQKDLVKLQIRGCKAVTDAGIDYIKNMKHLTILDISDCEKITNKSMKKIRDNMKLEKLAIAGNSNIDDTGISYLCGMDMLISMDVRRCKKITAEGIKTIVDNFKQITEFKISSDLAFSDTIIAYLKRMKNLTSLNVHPDKYLSEKELNKLRSDLPGVTVKEKSS